jgi:hypothetical protein
VCGEGERKKRDDRELGHKSDQGIVYITSEARRETGPLILSKSCAITRLPMVRVLNFSVLYNDHFMIIRNYAAKDQNVSRPNRLK